MISHSDASAHQLRDTTTPPPKRPSLRNPANWPMYLGLVSMVAAARLPWCVQRLFGHYIIGPLAYRFAHMRRRAAEVNVALCFPTLDVAQRTRFVRASFSDLGIGLFEFARAWWGTIAPIARQTHIEGLEHLNRLRSQGRGVLLVSGHFTTLEICGRLLCRHFSVAGMYRRHRHPVLEWAITRGRLRYAAHMFTNEQLRPAIRHLKRGGFLWYAPDQDMRGKESVFAPFFGLPASTITATHQLARLTGCAVVPYFHRRVGGDYYLKIAPPLEEFPSENPVNDTARINSCIQSMVIEAPTQYLWIHRRFKRQPHGRNTPYAD